MERATFENDQQNEFSLTTEMKEAFDREGFLVIRKMFSSQEMTLLSECFETEQFLSNMFTRSDGGVRGFQMALWWEPGDDTCGLVSKSRRVVETYMKLLDGGKDIYILSSKLIVKAPMSGGPFSWHQDYGYFYENGILFPNCGSVSIPLDRCFLANGCLQIIPGSHKMGRLNHHRVGDLASVDQERLAQVIKVLGDPVAVETEPGDVLFFHSNLLHTSGPNNSQVQRRNLVLAYNQVENEPTIKSGFLPPPIPLEIVEDKMIIESAKSISIIDKKFIVNKQDNSTNKLETDQE